MSGHDHRHDLHDMISLKESAETEVKLLREQLEETRSKLYEWIALTMTQRQMLAIVSKNTREPATRDWVESVLKIKTPE